MSPEILAAIGAAIVGAIGFVVGWLTLEGVL